MDAAFIQALLATVVISALSLSGLILLSIRLEVMQRLMHILIGLAAGALLGDAFIHLIPEAFEEGIAAPIFSLGILGGVLVFYILEKWLMWYDRYHANHVECIPGVECVVGPMKSLGPLVIVGDTIHNFVDGAIIAASFIVSPSLGVATAAAVILHEVPQEINDFALLIHSGFSRFKALLWNFLSALAAILGVIVFFIAGDFITNIEPVALAFTAGGFIYIAAANLIPELKMTEHPGKSALEFIAFLAGIGLMFLLLFFE